MDFNQTNTETGYHHTDPLETYLRDETLPENYPEDSESKVIKFPNEVPDRSQQQDYRNPSANQIENDEEDFDDDELNTDGEAFGQDYENNTNLLNEQPTDVSNLGLA